MSDSDKVMTVLGGMPPDQLERLLQKLRERVVTKAEAPPRFQGVEHRCYWLVKLGAFETVVEYRDATSQEDALRVAFSPLQAWYTSPEEKATDAPTIEAITHSRYCDWLRRGVECKV